MNTDCLFEEPPPQDIIPEMKPWLQSFPKAWAEMVGVGLARHRASVLGELTPGMNPVRMRQYPMSEEARKGIRPHIRQLLKEGILQWCHSPWNTPLLPIKKPGGTDYWPVQDLSEVNKRVEDIHLTVPSPDTLLSSLSPDLLWYYDFFYSGL